MQIVTYKTKVPTEYNEKLDVLAVASRLVLRRMLANRSKTPLCHCGCGRVVGRWEHTSNYRGRRVGEPKRFIKGHNPNNLQLAGHVFCKDENAKRCMKCGLTKSSSEFHKWKAECKACCRDRREAWVKANPEKVRAINRRKKLRKNFGLSIEQWNELLNRQSRRCAICGKPHSTGKRKGLFVDHCHKTNRVRGLVCQKCNTLLGMAGDDITILEKAIEYLKLSGKAFAI